MFVTVIHHIHDPKGFQAAEDKAIEQGLPTHVALPIHAATEDHRLGVCIWEGKSVDAVRELVESPADNRRDFHIERIRQKFGRLQVRLSDEGTAEVRAAIEEAENASVVTCEVCSAPGELADRRGWTAVRCPRHENWSRLDDLA